MSELKMNDTTVRYIAYSVILLFTIGNWILGVIAAATFAHSIILLLNLGLSIATLIIIVLLLIFNNRPDSEFFLAKLKYHVIALALIAESWFPMTILLTTSASTTCPVKGPYELACNLSIPGALFAYIICSVAIIIGLFVFFRGQAHGWNVNITQIDVHGPIHLEDEEQGPVNIEAAESPVLVDQSKL